MNISREEYMKAYTRTSITIAKEKKVAPPENQETVKEFVKRGGSIVICEPFKQNFDRKPYGNQLERLA